MTDKYRARRAAACGKLFEGFSPDLSRSRNPEIVLKVLDLAMYGLFSDEIAMEVGKSPKAIQKIFRRYNFPKLHNFEPRRMDEKLNWKGGVKTMKGYLYKITQGHPNGTKHGNYVAVHRLVMESKIGRYLLPTEVVDHIDGDITNNNPGNLRLFVSNAEHLRVTLKGRCPNWSENGRKSLDYARRQKRRTWKGVAVQPTPSE